MSSDTAYIPYCGTPPAPEVIWTRWNTDPVLIAALLGALALYLWGARRRPSSVPSRTISAIECGCFAAGWMVLALAWVSPLCNLTIALFSARVGQHMLVTLVAAPLLVLGRPGVALANVWPALASRFARIPRSWVGAPAATALFAAFLWLWHLPRPYSTTFESDLTYWTMHLTLLASALMLWQVLISHESQKLQQIVLAGFATVLQMGLLGAIITLAPRVLYAPHLLTTQVWGFTPLEDQQLGGLIMWIPGCAIVMIAALVAVARALRAPAYRSLST